MTLNYSKNLPNCLPLNQAHLSTFPFTQLSTAHVCFTEQIVWAAKLNATCKIECVQHPPGFLEEKCLDPPHTSILLIGNFHDIKRYLPVDRWNWWSSSLSPFSSFSWIAGPNHHQQCQKAFPRPPIFPSVLDAKGEKKTFYVLSPSPFPSVVSNQLFWLEIGRTYFSAWEPFLRIGERRLILTPESW